MLSAFFSGLSGLNSYSLALSVIGNNLANVNTVGYKGSTITFEDMLSQSLRANGAGNQLQVGLGVSTAQIAPDFAQGSLALASEATDMAIQGNGFFVLRAEGENLNYYTRAGDFSFDEEGNMVNPAGLILQGLTVLDADGNIDPNSPIGNITIPQGLTSPPNATTELQILSNLDADAMDGDEFSSSVQIYDSLGAEHTITVTFTKTAVVGEWTVDVTIPAEDVGGVAGDPPVSVLAGAPVTLTFDGDGQLVGGADLPIDITGFTNGANDQTINWDLVDDDDVGFVTQYASPSATSSTTQDGYTVGLLTVITVDADGVMQGSFTNGNTTALAQVVLGNFNNAKGLLKQGGNMYVESTGSGEPTVGAANSGGRGTISGSALEMSTVDIAREFTNLIISQRGYQSNSRTITTSDEIIQEALTLKR